MSKAAPNTSDNSNTARVRAGLKKRYAQERRFRFYGVLAITLSLLFLSFLFFDISSKGYTAFQQTFIQIEVHFDENKIEYFENAINSLKTNKQWDKQQIVDLFFEMIPDFGHKEVGKYLDSKM